MTTTSVKAPSVNRLLIDTQAIRENLRQLRRHLPDSTRIMAIVKSSGYGVGDTVKLTQVLASFGIDIFGLAYTHEAVLLREAHVAEELVVMTPLKGDIEALFHYDLQPVVSDQGMICSLTERKKPLKVHLHVNTGMNRLGCPIREALFLARMISDDPFLKLEGIMTHFCSAENPEQDPLTFQQIQQFRTVLNELKAHEIPVRWIHASSSAGSLRFHIPECNMVRPGLTLYGIHPGIIQTLPLKCALTLTSQLIGLHECQRGETVSYGRTHRVRKNRALIGVVPLGYHDGIHRAYSNRARVRISGTEVLQVGTICMDQFMVDVSKVPNVSVGDEVVLFGPELPPEIFAQYGKTIAHELISCLGPRIDRVFI